MSQWYPPDCKSFKWFIDNDRGIIISEDEYIVAEGRLLTGPFEIYRYILVGDGKWSGTLLKTISRWPKHGFINAINKYRMIYVADDPKDKNKIVIKVDSL